MTLLHLLWVLLGMALFIGTVLTDVSLGLRVVCALGFGVWAALSVSRLLAQLWGRIRVAIYRRRIRKEISRWS